MVYKRHRWWYSGKVLSNCGTGERVEIAGIGGELTMMSDYVKWCAYRLGRWIPRYHLACSGERSKVCSSIVAWYLTDFLCLTLVRQRAKRWYQSIKPIIQQKVCVILGHVSEISYEEHLTPFYGASIAELQFTDSDIYYSEPAMLMYYNDALSLAAQVLAPLRALLEIVLANHEPTDEVEGILPASARNKTDDNTVYGAVARYVSFISFYAKRKYTMFMLI